MISYSDRNEYAREIREKRQGLVKNVDVDMDTLVQQELARRDEARKKKKQEEVLKRKGRSSSIITGTGGVSDDALGLVGRPEARSSALLG
jgi:hypothetical protein